MRLKSSSGRSKLLKIIIRINIFLIHMYLWGTNAVFLWRYPHISNFDQFWVGRLKSSSSKGKLFKIIIRMMIFLIELDLCECDVVFLSSPPHISNWSNFDLGSWNRVLAKANCSRSSSGWWYFCLDWFCVNVLKYSSLDITILQIRITLHGEIEIKFWQRKKVKPKVRRCVNRSEVA